MKGTTRTYHSTIARGTITFEGKCYIFWSHKAPYLYSSAFLLRATTAWSRLRIVWYVKGWPRDRVCAPTAPINA